MNNCKGTQISVINMKCTKLTPNQKKIIGLYSDGNLQFKPAHCVLQSSWLAPQILRNPRFEKQIIIEKEIVPREPIHFKHKLKVRKCFYLLQQILMHKEKEVFAMHKKFINEATAENNSLLIKDQTLKILKLKYCSSQINEKQTRVPCIKYINNPLMKLRKSLKKLFDGKVINKSNIEKIAEILKENKDANAISESAMNGQINLDFRSISRKSISQTESYLKALPDIDNLEPTNHFSSWNVQVKRTDYKSNVLFSVDFQDDNE